MKRKRMTDEGRAQRERAIENNKRLLALAEKAWTVPASVPRMGFRSDRCGRQRRIALAMLRASTSRAPA